MVLSGFVAVVGTDGSPVPPELIERLTAALAFRGPDGRTTRCIGPAALGHTALSMGARSADDCQPLSVDGTSWIVADARIDDRATLLGALPAITSPTAGTDAALVLRAFMTWDVACVDHLLGDFAFAIWDARSRRLVCACDHLGIRASFYTRVGSWLVVSNSIECLRQLPGVSNDLDDQAVADFLLFGHRDDPSATTFRDIRRLPPAHRLTWSAERGVEVRPYWELPVEEPLYCRAGEYADQLKALLNQAVADRARGERVGIFLSGGLDSTTIAGAAVRQNRSSEPDPVRGFTFVYESLIPDDERDATLAAADHLDIPVQFYVVDAARDWEAFTEADTPEPSLGSMHGEPRQTCYADMAAHSRVALNGEGTDNALHYEWRAYLSFLRRTHRWTRIAADALIFLAHRRRPPLLHTLMNGASRAGSDGTEPAIPAWMSIDLVERLHLHERLAYVRRATDSAHPARPVAYGSLRTPLWQSFFDGLDAAYTRVPLEVAYPFLDLRMLRFLMRVPVVPWCRDKYLMRYTFRDDLPEVIRKRPKTPLRGHPHDEKVRRDGMPRLAASRQLERYGSSQQFEKVPSSPAQTDAALRFLALSRWLARLESAPAAAGRD
jgi:asparagine synthase (glutamine-hydrolysing)